MARSSEVRMQVSYTIEVIQILAKNKYACTQTCDIIEAVYRFTRTKYVLMNCEELPKFVPGSQN